MVCCASTFWLSKAGNAPEEYEDAFQSVPLLECFAIADGATESSFAGEWARILVRAFATDSSLTIASGLEGLVKWLEPFQREWFQTINWEGLPWFAEEKARAGAFSTLLGLNFEKRDCKKDLPTSGSWHALAIGDSCLFQVRDDTLLRAFPLARSEQFSNCPPLLSSKQGSNHGVLDQACLAEGSYQPGDLFLLATDALAHWFLGQFERGAKPWVELSAIPEQADFEMFVTQLRQEHLIRNDDTTLILITFPSITSGSDERTSEEKGS